MKFVCLSRTFVFVFFVSVEGFLSFLVDLSPAVCVAWSSIAQLCCGSSCFAQAVRVGVLSRVLYHLLRAGVVGQSAGVYIFVGAGGLATGPRTLH